MMVSRSPVQLRSSDHCSGSLPSGLQEGNVSHVKTNFHSPTSEGEVWSWSTDDQLQYICDDSVERQGQGHHKCGGSQVNHVLVDLNITAVTVESLRDLGTYQEHEDNTTERNKGHEGPEKVGGDV